MVNIAICYPPEPDCSLRIRSNKHSRSTRRSSQPRHTDTRTARPGSDDRSPSSMGTRRRMTLVRDPRPLDRQITWAQRFMVSRGSRRPAGPRIVADAAAMMDAAGEQGGRHCLELLAGRGYMTVGAEYLTGFGATEPLHQVNAALAISFAMPSAPNIDAIRPPEDSATAQVADGWPS